MVLAAGVGTWSAGTLDGLIVPEICGFVVSSSKLGPNSRVPAFWPLPETPADIAVTPSKCNFVVATCGPAAL
jgi:hypothetical protein